MPYSNVYNAQIADEIRQRNQLYALHHGYSPVDAREHITFVGGAHIQIGNASKADGEDGIYNDALPLSYDETLYGGSGFASGTFRDTGYGSQEGVEAVGQYHKGGAMPRGIDMRPELQGAGWWSDFASGFKQGFNTVVDPFAKVAKATAPFFGHPEITAGLHALGYGEPEAVKEPDTRAKTRGKTGKGKKKGGKAVPIPTDKDGNLAGWGKSGGGWSDLKKDLKSADWNKVKEYVGLGKYNKLKGKGWDDFKRDLGKLDFNMVKNWIGLGKKQAMMGGNWFMDNIVNPVRKFVGVGKKKGKKDLKEMIEEDEKEEKEEMKGGAILGGLEGGHALIPKANMPSSSMGGMGKPKRKATGIMKKGKSGKTRAEVVKEVMKKRGVKLIEASKIVKAEGLW